MGQFALKAGGLALGDKLLVTGPTTGAVYCTAERIVTDDGRDAQSAVKGDLITLPVPVKVRERDKLDRVEQAAASN